MTQAELSALSPGQILDIISAKEDQILRVASDKDAIISDKDATISERETIIESLRKRAENLQKQIDWFKDQCNLIKSKQYGQSSESAKQLGLFDEDDVSVESEPEEPETEEITYTRKKPNRNDKNLDTSALPREENIIDLPEAEKICSCGNEMTCCGKQSKEELVFIPSVLKVVEHQRLQYTCRDCETIKQPPAVELPLGKSKASASLLSEILIGKYYYHLPFYRQSKLFKNLGLALPDNTIAGWAMQSAEQLEPLGTALWRELGHIRALQADETRVKILKPDKKAYMFLYHSYLPDKRFVIFDFNLGRGGEIINERLKDFTGLLQTDGYSGYNTQRDREDVITFGCWDHARRKYADVIKGCGNNKSGKAGQMLKKIAELYKVEAQIKDNSFSARKTARQEQSTKILKVIKSFVDKINAPPGSLLGRAVTYTKNQWTELTRYVEHGEAQISNCWVENLVRPFAVGRRNWLFMGNEQSAQKAALIYSLIQSAVLNDLNPRAYLEYVLNQVHRMRKREVDPATLLPHTIDRSLLEKSTDLKV